MSSLFVVTVPWPFQCSSPQKHLGFMKPNSTFPGASLSLFYLLSWLFPALLSKYAAQSSVLTSHHQMSQIPLHLCLRQGAFPVLTSSLQRPVSLFGGWKLRVPFLVPLHCLSIWLYCQMLRKLVLPQAVLWKLHPLIPNSSTEKGNEHWAEDQIFGLCHQPVLSPLGKSFLLLSKTEKLE